MGVLLFASASPAGLEFTARPKGRKIKKETPENTGPVRVQVFGTGEVRPAPAENVDAYAELLKEDTKESSEPAEAPVEPVAEVPAVDESETEFQALRNRIRTREVAEATAAPTVNSTARPSARVVVPARATPKAVTPAHAPVHTPPPAMETETITPQGGAKSAPKKAVTHPAMSSDGIPEAPSNNMIPTNVAFAYTHMLPSPVNLPKGTLVVGSTLAYGAMDSLEFSTNIIRDVQKQWNVQAKVPLIEYPTFMTTAFVDYQSTNSSYFEETNPTVRLARWQPGLVTAYEIDDNMAFFLGGNFDFGKSSPEVMTTSGYLKGARLQADWSWLYNPSNSKLAHNALAAGMTYDLTYNMLGLGLTHHWRAFQLGVHYMFSDRAKFLPIFGFQFSANF